MRLSRDGSGWHFGRARKIVRLNEFSESSAGNSDKRFLTVCTTDESSLRNFTDGRHVPLHTRMPCMACMARRTFRHPFKSRKRGRGYRLTFTPQTAIQVRAERLPTFSGQRSADGGIQPAFAAETLESNNRNRSILECTIETRCGIYKTRRMPYRHPPFPP